MKSQLEVLRRENARLQRRVHHLEQQSLMVCAARELDKLFLHFDGENPPNTTDFVYQLVCFERDAQRKLAPQTRMLLWREYLRRRFELGGSIPDAEFPKLLVQEETRRQVKQEKWQARMVANVK